MSPSTAMDYAAHLPLLQQLAAALPVLQILSRHGSWGHNQCSSILTRFWHGRPTRAAFSVSGDSLK